MSSRVVLSGLVAVLLAACSGSGGDTVGQTAQPELANQAPNASGVETPMPAALGHHAFDPAKLVTRFDANGDGKLQVSELPQHMQQHLAKADTNGDGVLTVEELSAARDEFRSSMLARLDTNHDGVVSDAERQAGRAAFAEKRFSRADKNGDGVLTADEVSAKKWSHLSVADANGDGKLTLDELKAAFASGKLQFPGRHMHEGAQGTPSDALPAAPAAAAPVAAPAQ
ncbi:MAG TPA: hypothetical protein VGI10_16465 [Polyangiaceae bacterium]